MYWPCGVGSQSGKNVSLFTSMPCETLREAKKVIENWKKSTDFDVLCAYIKDEKSKSIVYLEDNVDFIGRVKYDKKNIIQNVNEDNSKILSIAFDSINVQLEEHVVNYVFVEDGIFDSELINEFATIMDNSYRWLSMDQLYFYHAMKKDTKKHGTIISWCSPYDFEYPFSGYELVEEIKFEKPFVQTHTR